MCCADTPGEHGQQIQSRTVQVCGTVLAMSWTTGDRPPAWGLYGTLPVENWPVRTEETNRQHTQTLSIDLKTRGYLTNAPFALELNQTGELSRRLCQATIYRSPVSYCTIGHTRYVLWALSECDVSRHLQSVCVDPGSTWMLADGNHRVDSLRSLGCGAATFFMSDDPAIQLQAMPRFVTATELHNLADDVGLEIGQRGGAVPYEPPELDRRLRDKSIPVRTDNPNNNMFRLVPRVCFVKMKQSLREGKALPYKFFSTTPKPPAGLVVTEISGHKTRIATEELATQR